MFDDRMPNPYHEVIENQGCAHPYQNIHSGYYNFGSYNGYPDNTNLFCNCNNNDYLAIPNDNREYIVDIKRIFSKKANPKNRFILTSQNVTDFYSNDIDREVIKDISIPFSFDLELFFIRLYWNMIQHNQNVNRYTSNMDCYNKFMKGENVYSIGFQCFISNNVMNSKELYVEFKPKLSSKKSSLYKETLVLNDYGTAFEMDPFKDPLKSVINQCMKKN